MAQQSALSILGIAGGVRTFSPKTAAVASLKTFLQRRTLYPVTAWTDVGSAEGIATQVTTDAGVAHAANEGFQYRTIRESRTGKRTVFPDEPTKIKKVGADLVLMPARPRFVRAQAIAGAKVRITWTYHPYGEGIRPTDFQIFEGATVAGINYASALTDSETSLDHTVYDPSRSAHAFVTAAQSAGDHYYGVRARDASANLELGTEATGRVDADSSAPTVSGEVIQSDDTA